MKESKEIEIELREFWNIKELNFLAKFEISNSNKTSFRNIRTIDGRSIKYPNGNNISIPVNHGNYQEGIDYQINTFVAPDERRKQVNFEYLLYLDTKKHLPKELFLRPIEHIRKISKEYESPVGIAREAMSGMVSRLSIETSKKPETFIFELLQNADDYPDKESREVSILFKIIGSYLVVCHNGQPFYPNNVHALCSVNAGDKSENKETTGFKGIGFKSIFKHSNYVWVCSGGYSFRFDQMYHRESGNETFWQLIPIWTPLDAIEECLRSEDISSYNVIFAIKPKEGLSQINEYERSFNAVFSDERVLIFLRSVKSLAFEGNSNSFKKENSGDSWIKSDLPSVPIPNHLVEQINRLIDKEIDTRIPPKYKDMYFSKISFATAISNGSIKKTDNTKVYAYLPTELNFGFPFLLNGDFIPDGDRSRLFWDISWNEFLFESAGKEFIKWLAELWNKIKDINVITLFPDFSNLYKLNQNDEDKSRYLDLFKKGVVEGIKDVKFIPDINGHLQFVFDLLFDITGIIQSLGENTINNIVLIDKKVANHDYTAHRPLIKFLDELGIYNIFTKDTILNLLETERMKKFLCDPANNIIFLKYLDQKKWISDFSDKNIFLDKDSILSKSTDLYFDFGNDIDEGLLDFLEIKVLMPAIVNSISEIVLKLKEYSPKLLIDSEILSNKSKINALLQFKPNCVKFYKYLFKHYETLPDKPYFTNHFLSEFGIVDTSGNFIPELKNSNSYLADQQLINLFESRALPKGLFHLISPSIFGIEADAGSKFWTKLGVLSLNEQNVITFVENTIINHIESIFAYYKMSESDSIDEQQSVFLRNKELWSFIIMVWNKVPAVKQKEWKQHIEKLPIYTVNSTFRPMSLCYINDEGNLTVLGELMNNQLSFEVISPNFDVSSDNSCPDWNISFMKFGARRFDENYIIDEIVNFAIKKKPSSIDEHKKIITKLFDFHVYGKLTKKHYDKLKYSYVRIKSEDETEYEWAYKCHFSSEYMPVLDLELLTNEFTISVQFIDTIYLCDFQPNELINSFFINIGVKNNWIKEIGRNVKRSDMPEDYTCIIDETFVYVRENAKLWSSQHFIEMNVVMLYQELLYIPKLSMIFWEMIISDIVHMKDCFLCTIYVTQYRKFALDNYFVTKIKQTCSFPSKDGQNYRPIELYGYNIGTLLNEQSKTPLFDLSKITIGNKTLEEILGFKTEYDIELCLKIFSVYKDERKLKKLGVWQKLVKLCDNERTIPQNDKDKLKEFGKKSQLINELGEWVSVCSLKILEKGLDLGFGSHPNLLNKSRNKEYDLTKVGLLMDVEVLTKEDFNPYYENPFDEGFKDILLDKLSFIAFVENNEEWIELKQHYEAKLSLFSFLRTNKIIYHCKISDPPIEQTERVFDRIDNEVYYVGRWNGPFSSELFHYIHSELLALKNITQKVLTELLLFSSDEILALFDEKNIKYPPDWISLNREKMQVIESSVSIISEPKTEYKPIEVNSGSITDVTNAKKETKDWTEEISDQDMTALEILMGGSLTDDDKKNQVILALFRALQHYESIGYDVSYSSANIEECIKKRMLVGVSNKNSGMLLRVMARSAKSGILKLNYNAWFDLMDADCELFVVTGNGPEDTKVFKTQESLASNDPWVIKLDGNDKYGEIQSLIKGEYADTSKKFAQFQFLIRLVEKKEFQSIFEQIPEIDGNFESDSLD